MARYLMTAIVTYEIDDVRSPNEALDVFKQAVIADPSMDGVNLVDIQDAFASEVNEDGTLPSDPTITEWEEINPFTRATED